MTENEDPLGHVPMEDIGPGGMRGFSIRACQNLTNSRLVEVRRVQKVVPSQREESQKGLLPFSDLGPARTRRTGRVLPQSALLGLKRTSQ